MVGFECRVSWERAWPPRVQQTGPPKAVSKGVGRSQAVATMARGIVTRFLVMVLPALVFLCVGGTVVSVGTQHAGRYTHGVNFDPSQPFDRTISRSLISW